MTADPAGLTMPSRSGPLAGLLVADFSRNAGVVYAPVSGFGTGPEGRTLPGYDFIVQAISGFMSLTGDPDGELIITAGNDGQFRRLCEVPGVLELSADLHFLRNEDRTAHRAELRPLLVERLRTRPKRDWFRDIIGAGVPCGPINTIDQGVAFAEEVGLDPVVTVGEGAAAVSSVRNPITFSATAPAYRLPPSELDEHGAELRRWLAEPAHPADEERSV